MSKENLSYKEAFSRLQAIHERIDGNQLDVDELTAVLKEATDLLRICKDKLFIVNEETQKILKNIQ